MPPKAQMRNTRATSLHHSIASAISITTTRENQRVPIKVKRSITASLIDLKRNADSYGLGPIQKELLKALINQARKAKTSQDLVDIHRKTCAFGLETH